MPGERLRVVVPEGRVPAFGPRALAVPVLLCDGAIVAIDKPAGLAILPGKGFEQESAYQAVWSMVREAGQRPRIVHRLDKGTSGVLVFARTAEAQAALGRQFEERTVRKVYRAFVRGRVASAGGVVESPIGPDGRRPGAQAVRAGGRPALTRYRVVARFRRFSDLEVEPESGRTHQIRVHLSSIGHPLIVDPLYGSDEPLYLSGFKPDYRSRPEAPERPLLDRTPLHACRLELDHPATGERLGLEAPLPRDMAITLRKLEKWG